MSKLSKFSHSLTWMAPRARHKAITRFYWLVIAFLISLNVLSLPVAAASGNGTMTVSPTVLTTGLSRNLTFTFGATANYNNSSILTLQIPANWTAPQTSAGAGQVTVTNGTGTSCSPSLNSITGTGPWTITVNMGCNSGHSFILTYNAVTALQAGSYTFTTATRSGSSGTPANIPTSPVVTVTQRSTSTSVACTPTSVSLNASTTCTATVRDPNGGTTSTPSGTVSWSSDGTGAFGTSASCTLSGSGSSATCSVTYTPSAIGTGSHTITASYGGDGNHNTSSGNTVVTVTKRSTSTSVACTPTSVILNVSTTCTATVNDTSSGTTSTPSGTVSWSSNGTGAFGTSASCTLSGSGSSATCSVTYTPSAIGTGSHTITASYGGDGNHNTSSGNTVVTVTKRSTSTSVACTPTSVSLNASTTCTATVNDTDSGTASTPSGTVSWSSSATGAFGPSASCTLSGSGSSATCSVTYTPSGTSIVVGSHTIMASYNGDNSHNTSSNTTSVTVTRRSTSTSVACTPNPDNLYASTTCTATVNDTDSGTALTPSGTVSWSSSGTGNFSPVTSCTLSGSGSSTTCFVTYTPSAVGTGSHTITASYGSASRHNTSSGSTNLTVNKLSQTITFNALANKTYGNPAFTVSASASSGLAVSFSSSTTSVCTVSGASVTIVAAGTCTITASQSGDTNYNAATSVSQSFTVNKKTASVSAVLNSKTYGAIDPALTTTNSGFVAGDLGAGKITFSASRAAGESVAGSPYLITPSASDNSTGLLNNYTVTYNTANFTINKAALAVNAVAASKTYGGSDPTFAWTYSGFVNSENATSAGITGSAACTRTAGETVAGGPYTITCAPGTLSAANYSFATGSTATFTINKATPTVSVTNSPVTYNGAAQAASVSGSVAGTVSNIKYDGSSTPPTDAGTYAVTADFTPSDTANYNSLTGASAANFVINKAVLAVNAVTASKTYGDGDPTFAWTYSGFVNSETATSAGITGNASCTRPAGETVAGNPYTITCTPDTLSAANYSFATGNTANFTINAKTASVTPNAASKTYGAADPSLSGTLSGFLAGDNVTATYSRAAGETVAGGPYVISAALSPAGVLGNYNITYNTASFTINKATLTVTANNKTRAYGDANPTFDATISGFQNGETLATSGVSGSPSCTTTATTTSSAGTYPITCANGTLAASNYTFSFVAGTLTVIGAGDYTSQITKAKAAANVYTSDSSGTAVPGTWTLKYNFTNSTNPSKSLRNVYYQVTAASTGTTLANSGATGGSPAGSVGAILTVPNSALPNSGLWTYGSTLQNQTFQIHVTSSGWSLTFAIYAVDNSQLNSIEQVGTFTISSDDVNGDTATPTHNTFLPLIQN